MADHPVAVRSGGASGAPNRGRVDTRGDPLGVLVGRAACIAQMWALVRVVIVIGVLTPLLGRARAESTSPPWVDSAETCDRHTDELYRTFCKSIFPGVPARERQRAALEKALSSCEFHRYGGTPPAVRVSPGPMATLPGSYRFVRGSVSEEWCLTHIDDENVTSGGAAGDWFFVRVGPLSTTGGNGWIESVRSARRAPARAECAHAPARLSAPRASRRAPPRASAWRAPPGVQTFRVTHPALGPEVRLTGTFLGSSTPAGALLDYPPLHQHHFHLVQNGSNVLQHEVIAHGDSACKQSEGGAAACHIRLFPPGFVQRMKTPLTAWGELNDVRLAHSEPLKHWVTLGMRFLRTRPAVPPRSLTMLSLGYGNGGARNEVKGYLGTLIIPGDRPSYAWEQGTLPPLGGRAVWGWWHSHLQWTEHVRRRRARAALRRPRAAPRTPRHARRARLRPRPPRSRRDALRGARSPRCAWQVMIFIGVSAQQLGLFEPGMPAWHEVRLGDGRPLMATLTARAAALGAPMCQMRRADSPVDEISGTAELGTKFFRLYSSCQPFNLSDYEPRPYTWFGVFSPESAAVATKHAFLHSRARVFVTSPTYTAPRVLRELPQMWAKPNVPRPFPRPDWYDGLELSRGPPGTALYLQAVIRRMRMLKASNASEAQLARARAQVLTARTGQPKGAPRVRRP